MPLPPLRSRRGVLASLGAGARAALVGGVLAGGVLLANVLQVLSLAILPFSRRHFRNANTAIAGSWWRACVRSGRFWLGIRVEVVGDSPRPGENAVVLANHQSMADIPVLLDVAERAGRLRDLKWYVKDILKYVPGIGWGMLFLDCLFIKRDWTADRRLIARVFSGIVSGRVPLWIVSFLEGTRVTPGKIARGQAYAAQHGLPVLEHLLIPRTKGFVATLAGLQGHVDAIYDVTIGYDGSVPTLWQWFLGEATRVTVHLARFPVAQVPVDGDELTQWVMARYAVKDQLLDRFYRGLGMATDPAGGIHSP
jgi:1-acyl-sn-glycerol-3-phosphate acyltransferase